MGSKYSVMEELVEEGDNVFRFRIGQAAKKLKNHQAQA